MRDIISTFAEFGPMAKRKLPSEAALTDLFAGAQAAEREVSFTPTGELDVDARETYDPNRPMVKGLPKKNNGPGMGMGMQMLSGGLQGLSKMGQSQPMQMQPIMMGDPIQLQEQNISRLTGLPGYYRGGRIRRGERGIVGDEIVEVDEFGATVIPAERAVSRTPDGELEVDARYGESPVATQSTTDGMSSPDPRQLIGTQAALDQARDFNPDFGEQYGVQQTEDPLTAAEAKLAEASQLKPSGWKDFGYSLVQGLNNYFNKTNDTKTYSEIQRDRRVAQIAPQVELLRQQKKREQDAIDTQIKRRYQTAQATNLEAQPGDRDAERERKTAADKLKYDYQVKTLDWKKEDREKYWEWEEVKAKALQEKDKRNYDLAVRKQGEIERANKAKESATVSRETNLNRRHQIAIEARRTLEEYKAAQASGRQEKALEAKAKLAKLKTEDDEISGLSATGEGIPNQ